MRYFLFLISCLLFCFSCVRDVDLSKIAEKKTVIEGKIYLDSFSQIKLSETIPVSGIGDFLEISDASITIEDNQGNLETLSFEQDGTYAGTSLKGETENRYKVNINVEGKEYIAITEMPSFNFLMDSLILDTFLLDSTQNFLVYFRKTNTSSLYCSFQIFRDGVPLFFHTKFYKTEITVQQQTNLLLANLDSLTSGTVLRVEVELMEKWLFEYLEEVQETANNETIGGLLVGPPDNLQGNIEGDGLGYFGAVIKNSFEIIVP